MTSTCVQAVLTVGDITLFPQLLIFGCSLAILLWAIDLFIEVSHAKPLIF